MKAVLIVIISLFLSFNYCLAQWKQTDGPYGPTPIFGIIEHDSLLLTFANNGYFSKNHLADNWEFKSNLSFSNYAKKGDSLFVLSSYYGLKIINLKNLNDAPININSTPGETIAASDSLVFLGSPSQGFLISNDNGKSWVFKNNGLPIDTVRPPNGAPPYYVSLVRAICVTNKYIYCSTQKGIYRSTSDLSKWISINSGLPNKSYSLIKEFNDTLYSVTTNSIYRSSDFGNSWDLYYTAPSAVTTLNFYNNGIYVGTINNGIYHSLDNSLTWNSLNIGLTDLVINAITNYDTTLICGTNNGIFYLKNFEWINNQSGLISSYIRTMDTSNGNIVANINDSVYTSNNGETWQSIITPIFPKFNYLTSYIGSILARGDTIFMSYQYNTPNFPFDHSYIKYTIDNGGNWHDLKSKIPYSGDDALRMRKDKSRLYVFENDRMYYTDDLGLNWLEASLPSRYCNMFFGLIIFNSTPFAIACGNAELLKLNSTLSSWDLSNKGLPTNVAINSIACNEDAVFAYLSNHKMYVSDKNGDNWVIADKGLESISYINSFVHKGNLLFIATNKGVFATNDFGNNWHPLNDGLKNLNANSIVLLKDTLYVGTSGNGIWKLNVKDLNFNNSNKFAISKLFAIYPNPANDFVQVENGNLNSIYTIFDLSGRKVSFGQIDSNNKIYVSNLKIGIYILEVRFGDETKRTKLLINR
jgi:hypothetical protein